MKGASKFRNCPRIQNASANRDNVTVCLRSLNYRRYKRREIQGSFLLGFFESTTNVSFYASQQMNINVALGKFLRQTTGILYARARCTYNQTQRRLTHTVHVVHRLYNTLTFYSLQHARRSSFFTFIPSSYASLSFLALANAARNIRGLYTRRSYPRFNLRHTIIEINGLSSFIH